MKKIVILCFFLLGITLLGYGQLSEGGKPHGLNFNLNDAVPFVTLEHFQDEIEPSGKTLSRPMYAGYAVQVNTDIYKKGRIDEDLGKYVWRFGVSIEKAEGINLYFKNVNLNWNEKIFLYDNKIESVLGAFTHNNNGPILATAFIPGDSIIIEFSSDERITKLPFELDKAGVSVNKIDKITRDFGDSQSCEVLVNCPEGDEWQREKKGVARILVTAGSSLFWCSGSLINNTNVDGTPYFLTASHCADGADDTDISSWVFYFNFESNNCLMPVFEPDAQSLSGASVVARTQGGVSNSSDFLLLLLDNEVPDNYYPYYNGWDRSENISPNGKGIHHPEGDLKMISTYNDPLVSTNYNNTNPNPAGKFWKVVWSETSSGHGVTEGGSSGSPIFSPNRHIVGTLSGGKASCNYTDLPDYYGKFSYSWESNGTQPIRQLKPWLDPLGTDVEILDGTDLDSSNIKAGFVAEPTQIIVGQSVLFKNQSEGDIAEYYWEFQGGDPSSSESSNPPPVTYNKVGIYNAKLVVRSEKGRSDSLVRQHYIEVMPNLFPNPSNGEFNVVFEKELPREYYVHVYDLLGREIPFTLTTESSNAIKIDLHVRIPELYIITIEGQDLNMTLKAMICP